MLEYFLLNANTPKINIACMLNVARLKQLITVLPQRNRPKQGAVGEVDPRRTATMRRWRYIIINPSGIDSNTTRILSHKSAKRSFVHPLYTQAKITLNSTPAQLNGYNKPLLRVSYRFDSCCGCHKKARSTLVVDLVFLLYSSGSTCSKASPWTQVRNIAPSVPVGSS